VPHPPRTVSVFIDSDCLPKRVATPFAAHSDALVLVCLPNGFKDGVGVGWGQDFSSVAKMSMRGTVFQLSCS
jgi:hypothetical protein